MSCVFLAEDVRLGKYWAVKVLSKQRIGMQEDVIRRSCLLEMNALKKLDHPALPRIVDFLEDRENLYLVMDYIQGESLEQMVRKRGAFSEGYVRNLAIQICGVLDYMHTRKPPVLYRDMKPSNVIVTDSGNVKLIDFGISGEYREKSDGSVTAVLGTGGYAPPEQYRGMTDERSDLYALGMTIIHLLTGEFPDAGFRNKIWYRWDISINMKKIIWRCTQPDPRKRYQNCKKLLMALERKRNTKWNFRKKVLIAGGIFVAGCIWCLAVRTVGNQKYQRLVNDRTEDSTTSEGRIHNYLTAMELQKGNPAAYQKLLEEYCADGCFTVVESNKYAGKLRANQEYFLQDDTAYHALLLETGLDYFFYYQEDSGEETMRNRILRAGEFFSMWSEIKQGEEKDGPQERLAVICLTLMEYYESYSDGITEPDKGWYVKFAEALAECVSVTADYMETGDAEGKLFYAKLQIFREVANLICDNRAEFFAADVSKDDLISVLQDVYDQTEEMQLIAGENQREQKLLLADCKKYQREIQITYENQENR